MEEALSEKPTMAYVFANVKLQKGWAKVKHESGLDGWLKRDLLRGW